MTFTKTKFLSRILSNTRYARLGYLRAAQVLMSWMPREGWSGDAVSCNVLI